MELGQYWQEVILAYVIALSMLIGLIALSFVQSRRTKAKLDNLEYELDER